MKTGFRIDSSEDGLKWNSLESNTSLTLDPGTTNHTYTDGELDPGDTRRYRVFANDGGVYGNAGISTEAIAGIAGAPGAVPAAGLNATAVGTNQIDLTWNKPTNDGGGDITAYLVQISSNGISWTDDPGDLTDPNPILSTISDPAGTGGHVWVKGSVGVDPATSYSHKKLSPGSRYYYRVRAYNGSLTTYANGNLAAANTALTDVATTAESSEPDAPTALSAHPAKDSSLAGANTKGVYVTWLASDDPTGDAVSGYEIERMVTGQDNDTDVVDDDRTFYNDTEDLGTQVRTYRVRAMNSAGYSPWTDWVTYPLGTHAHVAASGTIPAQTVTAGMSGKPMDVKDHFTVTEGVTYTTSSSDDAIATASVDGSMVTIMGTAGVMTTAMATITVTATDDSGTMATQDIMVTVEAAVPPTLGMATNVTIGTNFGGGIQVNWDAADNATGYFIYATNKALAGSENSTMAFAVNDRTAETWNLSGLTVGQTYYIYVVATSKGMEEWPDSDDVPEVTAK